MMYRRNLLSVAVTLKDKLMNSLPRLLSSAALLCCGILTCDASFAGDSSMQEPGIWQKHTYTFQFAGFTTTYSCGGLADKLKLLLVAAGARSDSKSMPGACSRSYGSPDKFALAYLNFYTLTPASAAASAEGPRVAGTWRSVAFASRSPRQLAIGDCELVEQFRTFVLPMFTTRNIDNQMTCIPHQESGSVINLKFEAFAAAPAKPANAH
jgi:hypothetical protein